MEQHWSRWCFLQGKGWYRCFCTHLLMDKSGWAGVQCPLAKALAYPDRMALSCGVMHSVGILWCGNFGLSSVSSVTQSCPTLCDPMNCSMPDLSVHHQLLEFTQTHVHWVGDVIQPSHPLSYPSAAFNLSQHQGLFQWISFSHQLAKVLEFQLQHQSFQWTFRTDFL